MTTRLYEVQEKMFDRLNNDKKLSLLTNGIFDYVPESTICPYVTFGHFVSTRDGCKTNEGERVVITLDIWSESKGRKESINILNLIEDVLKAEIELDSAFIIEQKVTNREVWEEAYGLFHATIDFEFQIDWEE